jgi:hypothetical protein
LTILEDIPCDTSIQGAPHLDEQERGSHHLWLIGPELRGLKTYQARDLLVSTLAYIWDDGAEASPDVENDIYNAKKSA